MSSFTSLVTVEYPTTNGYSYQEYTINMSGQISDTTINMVKMTAAKEFKQHIPGYAIKSITVHYSVANI